MPSISKIMGFFYVRSKRNSTLDPNKTYVFIFLGEFGYELLDWQGKIRYLKKNNPELRIAILSRNSCEYLYKNMGKFIPLDTSKIYIESKADSYFARPPQKKNSRISEIIFSIKIHYSINKLAKKTFQDSKLQLVFSDRVTFLEQIQFGANIFLHGNYLKTACYQTGIYETVTLYGNDFQIPIHQSPFSEKMGENYVLFMKAERSSHNKDFQKIIVEDYLHAIIPGKTKKIFMVFHSSRVFDSHGSIDASRLSNSITQVLVETLSQQLELIASADFCVFFTQGDLRSHVYLPPLIGKDVYVVSSDQIANYSYIDHWNKNVFNFGGKIKMIGPKKDDFIDLLKTLAE